jgi:signal transduction histidine kinase
MDRDFIQTRLFRPFDSTKGLTGMGIGAYECREVISAIGGQTVVESEPGRGTRFIIMLPYLHGTAGAGPVSLKESDNVG